MGPRCTGRCVWSKTARHPGFTDTHVRRCETCEVVVFRQLPPWQPLAAPYDERDDWPEWEYRDREPGEDG